ncbi:SusC/RagA family TonB-linked outer membrane protein [Flavobacterium caeni]|uniref:TonB-linked outer membrane protein, SusC/RagA family n=1 Tax=Flavobacterium caeni TaxID=490189 RepID=A0A1G5B8R8_9FLAO|nr:SusC/RagA family TonB-linked outer membrane protein [Flavobacterium caeni]SCX86486.1 TonB-linked outer membrane protein, SusC/RagA family [Flavobacterium caeni]
MKKVILLVFLFCLGPITAFGQQISGTVSDKTGLPLPGVNINSATGKSAVTDFDGKFSIDAAAGEGLTFTMIGYVTQSLPASANMAVSMPEEENKLNEVVVVGYGTRKLGSITGSVSLIKSADIVKTPAQSAVQAIQGKAAGVNIVANDEPGAAPSIRIRGLGTILNSRDPLYIINGVEAYGLNGISPNDIESINILKDASSLAIYGQKGANGVVIVTTKRGKQGDIKVSYDSYFGQKDVLKKVKMADSYRFSYYNNSALGDADYFNMNSQPYSTDWFEEITRKGEVTNNSVSITGATEKTNFSFGVSHYTESGILLGTEYKRTNFINRNEYKLVDDKVKISHFVNGSIEHGTPKPLSAFTNAYKQSPIMPVRYPNGRWGVPLVNLATGQNDLNGTAYNKYNNVGNPVAQLTNTHDKSRLFTLTANVAAEIKLYKDLTFTSSFGSTAKWYKAYSFVPTREIWLSQNPTEDASDYATTQSGAPVNSLSQTRGEEFDWNWDNYLTYKKEWEKHALTVVAGISRTTRDNDEYLRVMRYNVPEQRNYWYLDFSSSNEEVAPKSLITNNHLTPIVSLAYFGRVEYEFLERYLLTGIVRREGISSFQGDKKWAVFPSVSAGWVVSNEAFLRDSKIVTNLKLRGGYGELGNGNGPSFNFTSFTPNVNYPFGNGQVINPGSYIDAAVDPNLTWESMNELDLGIDFGLLENRLTGTFDYYNRKSENLILPVQVPYVLSEGESYVNSGEITNKGIELTLRWDGKIGDNFTYYIGGNLSKNKNEVSKIDSPYFQNFSGSGSLGNGEFTKLVKLGEPLGSFYVFEQTGYDSGGVPTYRDTNGDGRLTSDDRINAGSYIPDVTYGFNIGFTYRNIDFSADAYGVSGNKIYNGKKAQRFGGENIEYDILDDFWTPSNPNAENPKPNNDVPRASTYYIEDGSFLRINNITLGYTLPKMFDKLDKVRLYVTAVNPFLFTEYSGYSPEIVGNENANPLRTAGIELDAYPTNKTFLVGANVSF